MPTRARPTTLLLLQAALAGCSGEADDRSPGGQTGEENGAPCVRVRSETLGAADRSPLGFSAEELLNALGAERRQTLTWRDGTSTPVRLGLTSSQGDIAFVERTHAETASGAEPALAECNPILSVPVELTLVTDDLALNEAFELTLAADAENSASVFHRFDPDALRGSFRPDQVSREPADELVVYLSVLLSAASWEGSLIGQAQRARGGAGPDTSVSAEELSIATF